MSNSSTGHIITTDRYSDNKRAPLNGDANRHSQNPIVQQESAQLAYTTNVERERYAALNADELITIAEPPHAHTDAYILQDHSHALSRTTASHTSGLNQKPSDQSPSKQWCSFHKENEQQCQAI